MLISRIENIGGGKNKIYIDEEYKFLLYNTDIRKYGLTQGASIDLLYDKIIEETVLRRSKLKALDILKRADRTESELRKKLKDGYYTDEIINRTIEYINSYNYLDDRRYAEQYIRYQKGTRSEREMAVKLMQKGVSGDIITEVMASVQMNYEEKSEDEDNDPEMHAVLNCIRKKAGKDTVITAEKKEKLWQYLYRRGFRSDTIKKALREMNIEDKEPFDGYYH